MRTGGDILFRDAAFGLLYYQVLALRCLIFPAFLLLPAVGELFVIFTYDVINKNKEPQTRKQ